MLALRLILGLAIAAQLTLAFALYPELPESLPTHFDAGGRPDGWAASSGIEWFVIPALLAVIGAGAGFVLPALTGRLARSNSPWLNVPDRERFRELPEAARVRAVRHPCGWLVVIGIELQVLTGFLVCGTFAVATKRWEGLPPPALYGLLGALLLTATALAVDSSRAVRREIAQAGPRAG